MPRPMISVAMSVYNGERFLGQAIESILAQTFDQFEFLILDDGSSDSTRAIIEGFAQHDSRIRPILRENRGLIASLNQLIDESQAPIIARMDADDICLPSRFAKQYAFLEANPDHGVIGCWTEDIGIEGEPYSVEGEDHPVTHADALKAIAAGQPPLSHPSTMYRRDLVRSVGGYHAAFRHCEDLDLWLRLASVTKIANIPERLVRYRRYAEQVSSRHLTEQQIGAAISRLAHRERLAGKPDPTESLSALPPLDDLDALFGRPGVTRHVRAEVAAMVLYSRVALADGGFEIVMRHIRDKGDRTGLWRTVARLMRFGKPVRAAKLALTLATT